MQGKKLSLISSRGESEYGLKSRLNGLRRMNPEIIANYDYYATPSMFIDGEKKYEAHLFESYESAERSSRMCWMKGTTVITVYAIFN